MSKNLYSKGKISDAEAARLGKQLAADLKSVMKDPLSSDKYDRREIIRSDILLNLMEGKDLQTAYYHARAADKINRIPCGGVDINEEFESGVNRSETMAAPVQEAKPVRHTTTLSKEGEFIVNAFQAAATVAGEIAGVVGGRTLRRKQQVKKANLERYVEREVTARGGKGQISFDSISATLACDLAGADDLGGNQRAAKSAEEKVVAKHAVVKTTNAARLKVAAEQAGQGGLFGFDGMGAV